MILERLYDTDLAQASYLLASAAARRAIVVDPRRDVQVYLDLAAAHGVQITDVTETHLHADYLSGPRCAARPSRSPSSPRPTSPRSSRTAAQCCWTPASSPTCAAAR
ncbi:hypothetical protein ACTXMZ_06645 [Brachybacterium alimentarium]|uniref:hypothetical protein n=1 Tax=Brachybacterium alimentarium TaxID=47845 RepID=UPI0030B8612C